MRVRWIFIVGECLLCFKGGWRGGVGIVSGMAMVDGGWDEGWRRGDVWLRWKMIGSIEDVAKRI